MGNKTRMVIMVATSMLAAATVLWLQGRYEKGDIRNAIQLVQTYRSKAGVSVPDRISYRHPGKSLQWDAVVQNSCFQHVRVDGVVTVDPAAKPVIYSFTVDINGPSIHPANDNGKALLGELDTPIPPSSASAALSASAAPTAQPTSSGSAAPTPSATAAPTSSATAAPEAP